MPIREFLIPRFEVTDGPPGEEGVPPLLSVEDTGRGFIFEAPAIDPELTDGDVEALEEWLRARRFARDKACADALKPSPEAERAPRQTLRDAVERVEADKAAIQAVTAETLGAVMAAPGGSPGQMLRWGAPLPPAGGFDIPPDVEGRPGAQPYRVTGQESHAHHNRFIINAMSARRVGEVVLSPAAALTVAGHLIRWALPKTLEIE